MSNTNSVSGRKPGAENYTGLPVETHRPHRGSQVKNAEREELRKKIEEAQEKQRGSFMKLLFTCLVLLLISISFYTRAQIPNGDFEEWSGGEPLNWYIQSNITQTTNAQSGMYAIKGESFSQEVDGQTFIVGASISNGNLDEDIIGYPFTERPKKLHGYYIFKPAEGETGYVSINVLLTKWVGQDFIGEKTIGTGSALITNTFYLDSVYTPFNIDINYYYPEQPDTIGIKISLTSQVEGSIFYVDNLSFLLTEIISPNENEILISGEKDTIEWDVTADNINIMYSLDDGNTYTTIESNYPADSGKYIWDIPDDLLSTKAKIKIEDSQDNSQFDERTVKFKPWQLTRVDANGDFELFEPNQDGWSFANDNPPMWPQSWWQKFDYQNGIDTITGEKYPNVWPFNKAKSSWYPDWPTFVKIFGQEQCYYPGPKPPYKSAAINKWNDITDATWDGSCEGFAVSSILYFYYKNDFLSIFPGVGDFENLYAASITDDARDAISQYYTHQYGNPFRSDYINKETAVKPDVQKTLQELKDMFSQDNTDARPLILQNNNKDGGWHTVTPYKLERIENTSVFNLRVYNNNNPGADDKIIKLDSAANIWTDLSGTGFGSGKALCYLGLESALHFNTPLQLKKALISAKESLETSRVEIYNASSTDITIKKNSEEKIGYADSAVFNAVNDAFPIVPKTGYPHPPIGYNLPDDFYSVQLSKFKNAYTYVSVNTESLIYNYRRFDAKNNEKDKLNFSDGLSISNPDDSEKNIVLETVVDDKNSEKVLNVSNVKILHDDSLRIKELNRENLLFNNYGADKDYDIWLRSASGDGELIFSHSKIDIAENTSHQIVPSWTNLETAPLMILIDNGNDGAVDDTLFIGNEITGINGVRFLTNPTDYKLYQNYPNPFNHSTKIKYIVDTKQFITLKVFDIYGREVATLVNKEQQPGNYEVEFNANDLSGGVYLYKLKAGRFIQIREMILLK